MRLAGFSVLLGIFFLVAVVPLNAATIQEVFEKNVPFDPGGELTLDNMNGSVEIRSWSKAEVGIWARIKVEGRDRDEAEELYESVNIEVEETSGRVAIYTDAPRNLGRGRQISVEYEINVPEEIDLDVRTVNGGVDVRTVTGHIRLRTTNGSVEAVGLHGNVQAGTTNGRVEVELLAYDGEDDLEFTTTNGSIRVTLPKDIRGEMEARTTNGHIETDFPITVQGRFSKKSIRGDLNGGGPTLIRLKTTNGSIYMEEAR